MSVSVVKLRPDTVLQVAKNTIKPEGWTCEWNVSTLQKPAQCRIVLNSWSAYLQHLLKHCRESKNSGSGFACRLPRCNIASGVGCSSYQTLANHVETSHLNRAHLYCPFRGCSSLSFSRPLLLESHVAELHSDILSRHITLPSPLLSPSWLPFHPTSLELPPLPSQKPSPGTVLIPPVKGTPRRQNRMLAAPSSQQSIPGSPKRRPRLQANDPMEEVSSSGESSSRFDFDDIPATTFQDNGEVPKILGRMYSVQTRGPQIDVARPQPILDRDLPQYAYHPPKPSILYQNFVILNNLQDIREPSPEKETSPIPCAPIVGTSRDASNAAN